MGHYGAERYMRDIEVSAYELGPSRIYRLHQALGYAAAMMDVNGAGRLAELVQAVHDHKGILQVHWLRAPSDIEKHVFKLAWSSSVGDGSDLVEHYLCDE